MTTETSGRLGLAAPEAPPGLAERLRGRAAGRRKRPGSGQKLGLGLYGPPPLPFAACASFTADPSSRIPSTVTPMISLPVRLVLAVASRLA